MRDCPAVVYLWRIVYNSMSANEIRSPGCKTAQRGTINHASIRSNTKATPPGSKTKRKTWGVNCPSQSRYTKALQLKALRVLIRLSPRSSLLQNFVHENESSTEKSRSPEIRTVVTNVSENLNRAGLNPESRSGVGWCESQGASVDKTSSTHCGFVSVQSYARPSNSSTKSSTNQCSPSSMVHTWNEATASLLVQCVAHIGSRRRRKKSRVIVSGRGDKMSDVER